MANTDDSIYQNDNLDYSNNPSWRIFRIMSEFVEGFTFLGNIHKSVTIFGSARLREDNRYYKLAQEVARHLSEQGYAIVTGGGPGIMEAGNRGAHEAGGLSVGLNIQLPMEQRSNAYVKQGMSFNYFFSRKVMLDFSAEAYVFFPGGFGTLDEFFEVLTLVQTGKMEKIPIVLMGEAFWKPLTNWMQTVMLEELQTIAPDDLQFWTITDDIEEAVRVITTGVQQQHDSRREEKGHTRQTSEDKLKQATRPMKPWEQ